MPDRISPIDVYSYELQDQREKLRTLHKYYKPPTSVIDAEFHLWYKDNSVGMLAAPSDYKYEIAVHVATDSVDRWMEGQPLSSLPLLIDYHTSLKLDRKKWVLDPRDALFYRNKVVYKKEGVVLLTISSMAE